MQRLSRRFAVATNRLYPKMTVDAAGLLVTADTVGDIRQLDGHKYCTVVTFRADGSAVATPVWFATFDGVLYFRSLATAAKVSRLRADERVIVAACDARGRPVSPPWHGVARILDDDQAQRAEAVIQSNYGGLRSSYERAIAGAAAVYVAVTPAAVAVTA